MHELDMDPNKKQCQVLDPHVVDTMKEFAYFSKQVDGHPWYFEKDEFNQFNLFGSDSHRIGVFDFLGNHGII